MPQSLKHEKVDPTDSKSRKRIFSYEYGSLCEIGLSIQASPREKVAYSNEKSIVISILMFLLTPQVIKMRHNVDLILITIYQDDTINEHFIKYQLVTNI